MRRLALLAVIVWICGCGSQSKSPTSAANENNTDRQTAASTARTAKSVLDADGSFRELPADVQSELRRAEELKSNGKLGQAIEALSRIIGEHPKTASAFVLRAHARAERHDEADAFADFSTAIELESKVAGHYLARGFFLLSHGNTAKALDDFDAALKLDSRDARAYNFRGMARLTSGELQPAIADFNRAIELDPKLVNAYTNRSFALTKADRRNDAKADLDRAIELDPHASQAYNNRGVLHLEAHEFEQALADFTQAIQNEANSPEYYNHRRDAYLALKRYAEAQADAAKIEHLMQLARLNEAIFRDRLSPKPYLDRGLYFLDEGQLDNAIANFDRALELDHRHWPALVARARAWNRRGEFSKAVADCAAALAIETRDEIYGIRGDAYRGLGQLDKAVADYDASQRFDGEVAEAWLAYAKSLREAGKNQEADLAQKRANDFNDLDAPRPRPRPRAGAGVRQVGATAADLRLK